MERSASRELIADAAAPAFARSSDLLARAYEFARRAHESQRKRGDGSPFIGHPVTVAGLLDEADQPEEVVAAALLHDVVENSGVARAEVEERFGAEVARLVTALSEDPRIRDYEDRKAALCDQVAEAGAPAAAIYGADKLANLRDARAAYDRDRGLSPGFFSVSAEVRLGLWRGDLEMVEGLAPKLPFLRSFRYELEAFEDALTVT
jgi:guanosine-3',5'-bis(diphosphate) 3'-pyrophosphohydrolase